LMLYNLVTHRGRLIKFGIKALFPLAPHQSG
jgi:hypothetical protein